MIIEHKLNFMTVDLDAQMQYSMIRVANFEPLNAFLYSLKISAPSLNHYG